MDPIVGVSLVGTHLASKLSQGAAVASAAWWEESLPLAGTIGYAAEFLPDDAVLDFFLDVMTDVLFSGKSGYTRRKTPARDKARARRLHRLVRDSRSLFADSLLSLPVASGFGLGLFSPCETPDRAPLSPYRPSKVLEQPLKSKNHITLGPGLLIILFDFMKPKLKT